MNVLLIEVQEHERTSTRWLRSVCVEEVPRVEDLTFYYRHLCGFQEAIVSVKAIPVPADFSKTLLSVSEDRDPPFPHHDVQASTEERRGEYHAFVEQICNAERSRVRLAVTAQPSPLPARNTNPRNRWASELLAELNKGSQEPMEDDEHTLGWILSPIHDRSQSRIVVDVEAGRVWESRMGTALYPDLVVSRRLTTATWGFQHSSSSSLLSSVLTWYLAIKGATAVAGVSGWLPSAGTVSELSALLAPFSTPTKAEEPVAENTVADHTVEESAANKPRTTTLAEDRPSLSRYSKIKATPAKPIVVLLQKIEQSMLFSKMEAADVIPLSEATFVRFISYMARGHGIGSEDFTNSPLVSTTAARWTKAQMGFCGKSKPLLTSWNGLWETVMAPGFAGAELLLRTMDAWDLCESVLMTEEQQRALLEDWIVVFRDRECVADRGAKVRFEIVDATIAEYLDQFLPRPLILKFQKRFRDTVASVLLRRGYSTVKLSGILHIVGARLLHPAPLPSVATVATVSTVVPASVPLSEEAVIDLGSF
jgi:hypothetical protein